MLCRLVKPVPQTHQWGIMILSSLLYSALLQRHVSGCLEACSGKMLCKYSISRMINEREGREYVFEETKPLTVRNTR